MYSVNLKCCERVYHIDRGYERIGERLNPAGAKINRESD